MNPCSLDNSFYPGMHGFAALVVYGGYVGTVCQWATPLRITPAGLINKIHRLGVTEAIELIASEMKPEPVKARCPIDKWLYGR